MHVRVRVHVYVRVCVRVCEGVHACVFQCFHVRVFRREGECLYVSAFECGAGHCRWGYVLECWCRWGYVLV